MTIPELQREAHNNAVYHGFWEDGMDVGTAIALMHSELSEALEEERAGNPEVYYREDGKPEGALTELADCVIRIADYCGARGWDLESALVKKMEFNRTRPYKHGKKF